MCVQAGQMRLVIAVFLSANCLANKIANIASYKITVFPPAYSSTFRTEHFPFQKTTRSSMASSEQTPPTSWPAPPTPEQTPPTSEQASATSEQAPPTSEQAPPTSEQAPPTPEQAPPTPEQASTTSEQTLPTSDTSREVDLTYKLVVQRIDGGDPSECSNPDDHISIRTDTTSNLDPPILDTNFVLCRVYCNWSGYHGDGSVIYNRREDTFDIGKSNGLLQTGHGIHGTIVETSIMPFWFGTRLPGGKTVIYGGRYVHLDVKFAAAAGSPARSVRVSGKRLIGNETLDTVTLSEEEKLRLFDKGNPWTRQSDD